LVEVTIVNLWFSFYKVSKEDLWGIIFRLLSKGRERLTMVKMRDRLQDMTARVQGFGSVNAAGGALAREQDDLGVGKRSRGDALAQSLAERVRGRHIVMDKRRRYRPSFYIPRDWHEAAGMT
jgi:glycerol-3-phosphate dehydrogenase